MQLRSIQVKNGRDVRLKFVAELLVANEALVSKVHRCNHLVLRHTRSMAKARISGFVSPLESGGREGTRTPDFLVANEETLKLRRAATIS